MTQPSTLQKQTRGGSAPGGPDSRSPDALQREARRARWRWLRYLLRNRTAMAGAVILLIMIAGLLFAPWIAGADPNALAVADRLKPPSAQHWLGTDEFGRDVWARVVYGSRLSLKVGFLTAVFAAVAGTALGLVAGYYRRLDALIMRLMDGMMAFPGVLLAIAIMAALGPRDANVIIALTIVYACRFARVVRSTVLVVREQVYVEAAVSAGSRDVRILIRHILPNSMSPIIVQGTYVFATAILSEAALSFLGVGASPTTPSWGNTLSEGRPFLDDAPWLTFYPGIAIALAVLALNLVGDALRDALDPRLKDL